jgi:SAM-dependent methyltransferase
MSDLDPKEIVRRGYDRVSYAYRADRPDMAAADMQKYAAWVAELVPFLPPDAAVLDLGCGNGVPVDGLLVEEGCRVTGVDLSPVQVERARAMVPGAAFICADMTGLEFAPASFDAVISFYALIHVPLAEQPPLLAAIRRWLKPGGYLMATVGHTAWTGTEENWLDVPGGTMWWSEADEATYLRWLAEAGFEVLRTRFVPEGDGGHTLVLARGELQVSG